MRAWCIFISFWMMLIPHAYGQTATADFKPPRTEQGKAFHKAAKRDWQRTDAQYLHPKQTLEKSSPRWFEKEKNDEPTFSRVTAKRIAGLLLFLVAVGLLMVLWNYSTGGALFARFKKKDRFAPVDEGKTGDVILDAAAGGGMSLKDLEKITDPREGLHALLVQALVRAAKQNNVALRRSMTALDVLAKIPKTWNHHSNLQALVKRSELVLFGGRSMSSEDYVAALTLAQPMFNSPLFKRGSK